MSDEFTEANYENAVVEINKQLGYTHIYGPDIARDYHGPLFEQRILPALERINSGLPMDPFFSEANQQYLLKSMRELRAGKGTVHELIEVEDE